MGNAKSKKKNLALFTTAACTAVVAFQKFRSMKEEREACRQKRLEFENRKTLASMVDIWERELWHSVVPFWLQHSVDTKNGGFFTCLNRFGEILDDNKFHWLQGRAVWTCSRLCRKLLKREVDIENIGVRENEVKNLLRAAHNGAAFLKFSKGGKDKHLSEGGQPIFFSTTRDGWPTHIQRSPYTAVFYVLGCLEYSQLLTDFPQAAGDALECCSSEINVAKSYFRQEALHAFAYVCDCINDPTTCGKLPRKHVGLTNKPKVTLNQDTTKCKGGACGVAVNIEADDNVAMNSSQDSHLSTSAATTELPALSSLAEVMCLSALSEEMMAAFPEQRQKWDGYVDDSLRRVLKHYCPRFKVFMEQVNTVKFKFLLQEYIFTCLAL